MTKFSQKIPAVNQVEYTPHFKRKELKQYCDDHQIFFQAFSSLGRQKPELLNDPVVKKLAEKYKVTVQVS